MLRRSITCLLAVGAVSALLTLSPLTAHAIPVAGDYVWNTGSIVSGTFTSNGTSLTTWNMRVGELVFTTLYFPPQAADNNPLYFQHSTYGIATDYAQLMRITWGGEGGAPTVSYSYYSPRAFGSGILPDQQFERVSSVPEPTSQSVPEPTALQLLALGLGLLALMGYTSQQPRQAGVQVG